MSPLATWVTPNSSDSQTAWVPLPAPGAPINTTYTVSFSFRSADEPAVVAHQELGLELAHGVQHHAHDDQEARTGQGQRLHVGELLGQERQHRDDAEEHGARPGDADQH